MSRNETTYLFHEYSLRDLLEAQVPEGKKKVAELSVQQIREESVDTLATGIAEELRIARLEIDEPEISVATEETQVDARDLPDRFIRDTSRPFFVPALRIVYHVPYTGDPALWRAQPSSYTTNAPRAIITPSELMIPFLRSDSDVSATVPEFTRTVRDLKQYMEWVNAQVDEFNDKIIARIAPEIEARRSRLSKAHDQLQNLGFKVRDKQPPAPPPSVPHVNPSPPSKRSVKATGKPDHVYDVAFSFAGENREYVEKVATIVRGSGVTVYYDKFEEVQMWGANLADHFADVYTNRARFIVMFISRFYAEKAWPTYERQVAQARAIKAKETVILPVRLDDTELPGLSSVKFIDASNLPAEALANLIRRKVRE